MCRLTPEEHCMRGMDRWTTAQADRETRATTALLKFSRDSSTRLHMQLMHLDPPAPEGLVLLHYSACRLPVPWGVECGAFHQLGRTKAGTAAAVV
jgi:hypothetical protein